MNRDDFELASRGYKVQNDRPERSEADRKDKTSCHASALAGRSARASTCQTWSPWAMTLHGIHHHLANKGQSIVEGCQSPRVASALNRLASCCVVGPGLPLPIDRPSSLVTATISAAVPVRNISSAVYRS